MPRRAQPKPATNDHFRTAFFSQVDLALRQGYEVVVCIKGRGGRKIVAMHRVSDRVLYFDPLLNPSMRYTHGLAPARRLASHETLPTARDEGNGLQSLEANALQKLFLDGGAYAWIPQAFRYTVAGVQRRTGS